MKEKISHYLNMLKRFAYLLSKHINVNCPCIFYLHGSICKGVTISIKFATFIKTYYTMIIMNFTNEVINEYARFTCTTASQCLICSRSDCQKKKKKKIICIVR